ncbi:MAG: NAD(P)/FAD-dependent oxidoreductase [Acidimicrobiia bacterium]|nr:NAD(P)/FAD-dependent oxidoreductase [Acidimicrobiia bacterium]
MSGPVTGPVSGSHDADVVIVGAGIGGLTAAAYLQATGRRCVVVDRHAVVGGNVSTFTHHGFEFDVGTHYVGGCGPGGLVASILGGLGLDERVRWRELDPDGFDRFCFPDATYSMPRGLERWRDRLAGWFPAEREGIDAYCSFVAGVAEAVAAVTDGGPMEKLALLLEHRDTTLGSLFDGLGLSPRLRAVLGAQHLVYGVGPARVSAVVHALVAGHYLDGAFYPEGGGQALSDALAGFVRDRGGEILLRTPVERILVEGGRAVGVALRPASPHRRRGVPDEVRAPVVVSNADLKRTVSELVGEEHLPADWVGRIRGLRMGPPLFVAYLVLDRDLAAEGHPNANAHVLAGDDVDAEYDALARGDLVDEPTLFLSFASLKDPTNARLGGPGRTNLQVMALVPPDPAFWGLERGPAAGERYRRNPAYRERKHELARRVVRLAGRAVPGLEESVAYLETATPITHERFVRSTGGTSYGFELTPDQSLDRRPGPVTPLPGLFLAGAGTLTAHGIAACMASGLAAAEAVTGEPLARTVRAGGRVAEPARTPGP